MNNTPGNKKLWGGRFTEPTDQFVERFTASVEFDQRLYHHDIAGSIAHATMLARVGIISESEQTLIISGLESIKSEIENGTFNWQVSLEDVHMNIEARLIDIIGDVGKKLHTGRSRNDQVATDIRLYLRDELDTVVLLKNQILHVLTDLAEAYSDTIMPGYTHLQSAQPITFGHHLMAWFEMLIRDRDRMLDCRKRLNVMPLGSAALAGTTFPIDRELTAQLLGFDGICENSVDGVSDRDFAIEFCAVTSMTLTHLSRWAEELVLWSSTQFGFIELPDRFCTGSSIMPQKKNPDVPELIRGKSGRAIGNLIAMLTLMKSQPLAYNKDNQEDKEPLFDSIDTLKDVLTAVSSMLPNIQPNTARMYSAAQEGFSTATDLADYLVRKGVPFRDAHEVVGKTVAFAIAEDRALDKLTLLELTTFSAQIEADVFDVLTLEGSVKARNHFGATAPSQVKSAVIRGRKRI
ncbi:MAG: argininosuccinate lyase [Pseudomonadales bacterium]|nr:argininosuccinate lyase [Pseudomonadales bacterium]